MWLCILLHYEEANLMIACNLLSYYGWLATVAETYRYVPYKGLYLEDIMKEQHENCKVVRN